jgi:hypothetical protein
VPNQSPRHTPCVSVDNDPWKSKVGGITFNVYTFLKAMAELETIKKDI